MRRAGLFVAMLSFACAGGGSGPSPVPTGAPPPPRSVGALRADSAAAPVAAAVPAPAVDDVVLITDRGALDVIDAGAGFHARVGAWGSIAEVLARDVRALGKADPRAGVGVAGNAHRLFDVRWLERGELELIGVVNRIDRVPLGGCGDVRLVYRLGYDVHRDGVRHASRLPMTVNLVYAVDDDGAACRTAAARWRPPAGLSPVDQARWLVDRGALAPPRLARARLASIQVNLQLVRWPSAVRPDLGGHAEYLLRAFRPDGERYAPLPLDNVPDLARLTRDRALRAELLAWIRSPATLARLDDGWAQLPARFLAERSISVAPRGFARRANRPFRQLFEAGELGGLAFDGLRVVRSAEAALRRLDEMTCAGCHQARTIAGFHLLGEEPADAVAANALAVPVSSHVLDEVPRRAAILRALAAGEPVAWHRPFAERGADGDGGWGARCGLGDPGFAAWTCGPGLRCERHDAPADDAVVGTCVPAAAEVGDACEPGPVIPHPDPHRDRIRAPGQRACAAGQVCNRTRVGFPGGMCTADCAALPAGAACGAIAILTPFNNCLARGRPFATCLSENVAPAGLRACAADRPCREDYICVRGATPGAGVCIPPYFLFQLRVDGHP